MWYWSGRAALNARLALLETILFKCEALSFGVVGWAKRSVPTTPRRLSLRPHPEEGAQAPVSKDAAADERGPMVRDAALRSAPHHEGVVVEPWKPSKSACPKI